MQFSARTAIIQRCGDMTEPRPIDADQRRVVEQIFARPSSGNVEWRHVRSLLDAVADVTEEHNGRLRVTLGDETEVLDPPHGKDVDAQMLVDLRRMLTRAGIEP
jgi:hypothetical protein